MITKTHPIVVIDLCAALMAHKLKLEAGIILLGKNEVEVACYSALDQWATRRALRLGGIMELFDYVWHMDAMMGMRGDELQDLANTTILNTPEQLTIKNLCLAGGIPVGRVPPYLRWLV